MDVAIFIGTCTINLVLGFFVLSQNLTARYARAFMAISVILCLWICANFFTNSMDLPLWAMDISNRLTYVAGFSAIVAGVIFTQYFPVKRTMGQREFLLVVVLALATVALSSTTLIAGTVTVVNGATIFGVGPLLGFYIAALAIMLILIIRNLIQPLGSRDLTYRSQSQLVLFAFIASAVIAILFNAVIPLLIGGWDTTKYGPLATIILVTVISYAIIRHKLFDVRLIAVRSVGYFLSLVTLAVVYIILAYVISRLFFQSNITNNVSFSPVNITLALLLAFIFQPIKSFFDHITNKIFYRDRYNPEEFFALLSNVLGTTTDLKSLLERAADVIALTLKSDQAFFYIRTSDGDYVVAGTKGHATLLKSEADHLDDYSRQLNDRIIVTESMAGQRGIHGLLVHRKIALLLPLYHGDGPIGYLALGEGLAATYTKRDLRVLETIADELVIAIQNAQAVEEVRLINASLQQRINGATRDLRSKNERLKQLDNTKDEFISLASHQLRTPLTSVKGYVSMMLDGDAGPITDQQRRFLTEAFDSSTRMAGIIGDFLNVSRLQTGKFMLERTQINLADIAESEVEHLQNTARMRNLKLEYKKPKNFPTVFADKSKIEQVMMNFMDNALFYAPESKVIEVELTHDGGKAIFKVRDHGIGVPKAEQAELFTKFFRATNARKQRPDGTGVGIFLAKKVITAHHGDVIFESKEGKGSTFGFTLPLLK
jgi:signal transduction histidine kinase